MKIYIKAKTGRNKAIKVNVWEQLIGKKWTLYIL